MLISNIPKENQIKFKLKNKTSFEQWCLDNNRQDILNLWDNDLNKCLPSEITYGTNKKYYFKCQREIHKSELKCIKYITNRRDGKIYCNLCNSFAQWGIDNLGNDFLEKYWDYEKNNELKINPWEIGYGLDTIKVWIICQEKDYHGSYNIKPNNFTNGRRCLYCNSNSGKVHLLDSLGMLYPNILEIWSDKNEKSPYEYAPWSKQEIWWKCADGIHKDYKRKISSSNQFEFRCPECQFSKGEKIIELYLITNNFIKDEDYVPQKEFNGLMGLKNGQLSYDFYLFNYNLLIEYQGEFHDGSSGGYSKINLKRQQEHDRRKKEYAIKNNINLLEIWYWDFDNIKYILDEYFKNKINNSDKKTY